MQIIKKIIVKWQSMSEVAKASIAFTISAFLLKGINFITTPVFTRIMDKTEYGTIGEYNSWQSIIEVFALLGLTSAGVFNVGMNDYKDNRSQYMSSTLTMCNIITLIVFAIIFFIKAFFVNDLILPWNLLLLMFLYFVFSPAQVFWVTRQRYEYKYKLAITITIASTVLSQAFSVLCVVLSHSKDLAVIKLWSGNIIYFLFAVPLFFYVYAKGKCFYDKMQWKKTLIFALPLLPHYFGQHVMSSSDRIMLANQATKADVSIYSVVLNISVIATIAWNSINASIIPYTFENLNQKKYQKINSAILPIIICYSVFCVFVALIAPEIIGILAPKDYKDGVYAVPPIVATAFLSALYNIYANIEFYNKKSINIAVATISAALVNVALNVFLIPRFGFVAAAYTTLISNIVLVFIHYIGYRKCNPERIYNDKLVLLISLLCIFTCELITLLYVNSMVRFSIIGLIIVLIFIFRKQILNMIHNLQIEK